MCPFIYSGECSIPPCPSCFIEKCKFNPINKNNLTISEEEEDWNAIEGAKNEH